LALGLTSALCLYGSKHSGNFSAASRPWLLASAGVLGLISLQSFLGAYTVVHRVVNKGNCLEESCLNAVRKKVEEERAKSSGGSSTGTIVIDAIDDYAKNVAWMMNVGGDKGLILDQALENVQPKLVLELGCYVGYSSIRMARATPPDAHIFSVEWSSKNAAIAREMIEVAGYSHKITIVEGYIGDGGKTIQTLQEAHGFSEGKLDFLFIDHSKDVYLKDLKMIMKTKWFHQGTVVVADNVGMPGAPDYKTFMEENEGKLFNTIYHRTHLEYVPLVPDMVLESVYLGSSSSSTN